MRAFLTLLLLAQAMPAAALDPLAGRIGEAVDIPAEDWAAMAAGRTLTYQIEGAPFAREHYYPGTDRVTLQLEDGHCLEGRWSYAAPFYCFYWEGEAPACFRHVRLDQTIVVIQTDNGVDTPVIQRMTGVSDTPLFCGPAVTS